MSRVVQGCARGWQRVPAMAPGPFLPSVQISKSTAPMIVQPTTA